MTLEALAPYRVAFTRPEGDPAPLPYLDDPGTAQHELRHRLDERAELRDQTHHDEDRAAGEVRPRPDGAGFELVQHGREGGAEDEGGLIEPASGDG